MHLVAIAISLIASSPEPAPNVSGASSACQAFVGTKPRPTDFRTLVSKLASLAKGKFETTAEFESRSQRVRSTIPHEVVLLVHKPRFAFDYDADSQTIAFDLGVFGLQDTTDLAQATWFAFPDAGYSGTGASFQLERNVFALGSYVAKNAFGASRKIAKSREIISLLNDEGVSERRNARVKLDKFTPSMAKLTGEAMRTALVVDMQDATAFHTRGDSSIPTMLNPRDVNSYYCPSSEHLAQLAS